MSARALARCAFLITLGLAPPLRAHTLEEGTARISLRDNHIDVSVDWDVFALIDAAPTRVATCDDATLGEVHARLRRRIEAETQLRVDGVALPLALTDAPEAVELRAIAARLSAAGQEHGARARLRLEVTRPVPGARSVSFRAPRALGPVLVSFVQPSTRYLRPGSDADFDVLARSRPVVHAESPPIDAPWSIASTLVALAIGAAVLVYGLRASAPEAS